MGRRLDDKERAESKKQNVASEVVAMSTNEETLEALSHGCYHG